MIKPSFHQIEDIIPVFKMEQSMRFNKKVIRKHVHIYLCTYIDFAWILAKHFCSGGQKVLI